MMPASIWSRFSALVPVLGLTSPVLLSGIAGCPAMSTRAQPDAAPDLPDGGTDSGPPNIDGCTDRDGDRYGRGADCLGDDCDDSDPALTDDCGARGNCDDGVHLTGCPCDVDQSMACYSGADGTANVGECRVGLRDCVEGVYEACAGQVLPVPEICDLEDNDCDGEVDEGVTSLCGNCDPECAVETVGVGGDHPFDPDMEGRDVVVQPDGSITLAEASTIVNRVIWIANTSEGTIAKVDTGTHEELGRYYTAPNENGDPSRSTVNRRGDVVSINRGGSSATFIMASDCPDQDGDGNVATSDGPDNVLPWGDDECVIWNLPIEGGLSRGAAIEERIEIDGTLTEYAWVSSYNTGMIYEVDIAQGVYTGRQQDVRPSNAYGAAMGRDHTLWVTEGAASNHMAKMDTITLDVTQYTAPEGRDFYGITVDRDGYVWTAGFSGALRFDPVTETFDLVEGGCGGGIAADADGNIWTANGSVAAFTPVPRRAASCDPVGVTRIDPVTLEAHVIETGEDSHGVAIDFDGDVWAINVTAGNAHVIDPVDESFAVAWDSGSNPRNNYTYSDMTGYQLANATRELGSYQFVFAGCDEPETTDWGQLVWDADTPEGTSVSFVARTADDLQVVGSAPAVPVAAQPPDASPVDIGDQLDAAAVTPGRYLAIEAQLRTTVRGAAPVVRQFAVQHSCGAVFE